jgi:phage terminase large subunit-like protein
MQNSILSANASKAEWLASLPLQERQQFLANLSEDEYEALLFEWTFWARRNQLAPSHNPRTADGSWAIWLILAGRGFGKTRSGAEWVRAQMCGDTPLAPGRCRHMALVAETAADARDVMVGDGKGPDEASGILQVHPKDFRPIYQSSLRRLTWPNGAIATLYNATEPEQLRGPQHDGAWCDELAKWRYAQETWDQLQFGLRIGDAPQVVITTTPKPIKTLKDIIADPATVTTGGSTYENEGNLAPAFIATLKRKYEGTRLGRQEIDAQVLDDVPGALWNRARIDELRVSPKSVPDMLRIVVAIDPATTSGEDSNETGIICAGLGVDGHGYVFADESGHYTPPEWAAKAIELYKTEGRQADRIIGEVNNGGDMIEATLRAVDESIAYKSVHASRGKVIRAEPIAALYERGVVHHIGAFATLEDQMCSFTTDLDRKGTGSSPDRADALVWAFTELMIGGSSVIFTTSERAVTIAPFEIPDYYQRVFAIDVDRKRVAALWGALDQAADTLYLTAEYVAPRTDLAVHAAAVRGRGSWVPGLFDLALRGDTVEGQRLVDQMLALNLDIYTIEANVESSILDIAQRLDTKRLQVFSNMTDWLTEFRTYRRNEKGEIIGEANHLMNCTGLLASYGSQVALTESQTRPGDNDELGDGGRDLYTGY